MKVQIITNTNRIIFRTETSEEAMQIGRLSARLRDKPAPRTYSDSDGLRVLGYELDCSLGEIVNILVQ